MIGFGLCGLLPKKIAFVIMVIAAGICFVIAATNFETGWGIVQINLFLMAFPLVIVAMVIIFKRKNYLERSYDWRSAGIDGEGRIKNEAA